MTSIENRLNAAAAKIDRMGGCKMRLTFRDGTTATVTAGKAVDLLHEGRDIVAATPYGECGYLADLIVVLADTTNDGGIEP